MTASPGRRYKASREDIIAAAWALFEEVGFEATTMTAIAERAGISRRTLFNQVDHKVALLYPGFDEYIAGFADALRRRPPDEPLLAALAATVWELAALADDLAVRHDPGPQVLAARLRDDAVEYWMSVWSSSMAGVVLDALGPDAQITARFIGAITAQIWSELVRLQRQDASLDVNQAVAMVMGDLEHLVTGGVRPPSR